MTMINWSKSVNVLDFIEDNSVKRKAHFYVYASKLQSSGENLPAGLPAWKEFMHWGIIVEYPETMAVYTFDADTSGGISSGEIIVAVKRSHPDKEILRSKKELGVVEISPKDLVEHAKNVHLTGAQYNFVFQNCQSWAYNFCEQISPELVRNYPTTIGDYTAWAVLAAGAAASLGFIGWSIGRAISSNRKEDDEVDKKK